MNRRRVLILSFLFIFISIVSFFSLRNALLRHYLKKKLVEVNKNLEGDISIRKAGFRRISTIEFENIVIKAVSRDTLLTIDSMFVDVRLLSLLKGNVRPDEIFIANAALNVIKKDSVDNYSFLLQAEEEDTREAKRNYSSSLNNLIEFAFDVIPSHLTTKSIKAHFEKDTLRTDFHFQSIFLSENNFSASIETREDTAVANWKINGKVFTDDYAFDIAMVSGTSKQSLPLLKQVHNLSTGFDSIALTFKKDDEAEDLLRLTGTSKVLGMWLNHWRVSPKDVVLPASTFNYNIIVTPDQFIIDSSSSVMIKDLPTQLYVRYKPAKEKELELEFKVKETASIAFFDALPEGLFEDVKGIKTKGNLSYRLLFYLPFNNPDSLQFYSSLKKKDFKILKFGNTNFSAVNGEFVYTVYEKEKPVRSFRVGPSNPNFTPIDQISPYLKASVLTSEDGNFYSHNGFNEEAFRESMVTNIKEKRFVRGGSTISMQLVKNLFLTRSKTVSRKVEEALIVWLIENNRLISKERMFEIYLNIIELGPGVHGIGEASYFYFNKPPSELTLEESIFLAMIVPRPKAFKYHFDEAGHLKPYTAAYFNLIAGHLVKRRVITEEEKLNLKYDVELKGRARTYFKNLDVLPVEEEEEELMF